MRPEDLTNDAKVILLLCGHFGKAADPGAGVAPLGIADYGRFSSFLHDRGLRPGSLLDSAILDGLEHGMGPVEIPRVRKLLDRGAAMGFAIESWMNKGLWVLCRSDERYPRRLKRELREKAPPILYGAGDASLLDRGGLAIVGSRKLGAEDQQLASQVANRCALDGVPVVSGGARGVDQIAMSNALDAGGTVIGVLADGLLKKSLQKDHRRALHDGILVMISTVHPEAGFNVGAAMARNKLIYLLADHALVVKAEHQKGGTWSGATEELKRAGGRPVFIHPGNNPPKVVDALGQLGAVPFPELPAGQPITEILAEASAATTSGRTIDEPADLFDVTSSRVAEATVEMPAPQKPNTPSPPNQPANAFGAVWPLLSHHLAAPITPTELAERTEARKVQIDDWLRTALDRGLVVKLPKPARFVLDPDRKLL